MISRSRRGNRQASMKARLGIATAVLIGGGAVGVAAVAASNQGPATTTEQTAGFMLNFHHRISERTALSSALNTWASSQQRSMNTLAQMVPMRDFSQVWGSHRTMYAAQRGVVVLATHRFLLVKSANGQMHLWWLSAATHVKNVAASATGLIAMTGNNMAAMQAMMHRNMAPASMAMAGSGNAAAQMSAPATRPATVTILSGNEVITITITGMSASVTVAPAGTSTPPAMTAPASTPTPTSTATQPAFTATRHVARGDLVFIVGARVHGMLVAKLVLFSLPATVMPTAGATPPATTSVAPTTAVSSTPGAPTNSGPSFSGVGS